MPEAPPPRICPAIREARLRAGMSQEALARKARIPQGSLSRYEKDREPSFDVVARIEQALGHPRGFLARAAGYIQDDLPDLEDAIASDPRLTEDYRQAILETVRALRRLSDVEFARRLAAEDGEDAEDPPPAKSTVDPARRPRASKTRKPPQRTTRERRGRTG